MNLQSAFLQELSWRGYIKSCTNLDKLNEWFLSDNRKFYIGFDCTANSLHIGSLMQIMLMRIGIKHGHHPVLLFGGATTKIGDPSGKDKTRQLLSEAQIQENMFGIQSVMGQFFDLQKITVVNNDDWLSQLQYIDFLRDFGSKFSINRMLGFDSVKSRISRQQELTFLEFNYMLMQAYDFFWLGQNHDCRVQFGGSDQWGNIVCGIELAGKMGQKELFGLTTPLLTTSDGKKMGKTAQGAIWLSRDLLSAYDYWQFFRNVSDDDVFKFLNLLTDFSQKEIKEFKDKNINEVKKILADEVTTICHGADEAQKAHEIAQKIFEKGVSHDEMPKIFFQAGQKRLIDLLVENQILSSKSEVKKMIINGAITLAGEKITDLQQKISSEDLPLQISIGKKRQFMITNLS